MSNKSYRQIFKATSLLGGTQVICIAIRVVQVKVLAVLLGPAGVGLAGMYTSAIELIGSISGMGIRSAGVRQIAAAGGASDKKRLARTVKTLRCASLLSGFLGMAIAIVLCVPLSWATFGQRDYASGIALVAVTLLFGGVSGGQMALLQGLRRLKELAACNILSAFFGMLTSVVLVYFLKEKGIAWYIVAGSAFAILTSWCFSRKVPIEAVNITWLEMMREARSLLNLGIAFMVSGLLNAGSAYLIRVLINHRLDLDAVGLYNATITLSSLYVGIVLGAMSADFYPRLTGVAKDHVELNRLINEQTEMGILMALPGILATLVFAPWILKIFYSPAFVNATDIIRWQILGVALRVVSWPMGFVLLAKGMSKLYIMTEVLFNVLHVGLIFLCMGVWGLEGLGIAFFLIYTGYVLGIMVVCSRITGFIWSRKAISLIIISSVIVGIQFLSIRILPELSGLFTGLFFTILSVVVCLYFLKKLTNFKF